MSREDPVQVHVCTSDLFSHLLCRWNESFQKEVLSSRLDTTHLLAKAIAKASQPPQAWILVTGVGMPPNRQPLTLTVPWRTEQAVEVLGAGTQNVGPFQCHCRQGLQLRRLFLTQICICHNVVFMGVERQNRGGGYLAREPLLEPSERVTVQVPVLETSPHPSPLLFALQFFMKSSLCHVSFETTQLQTIKMSSHHYAVSYTLFNPYNFMR